MDSVDRMILKFIGHLLCATIIVGFIALIAFIIYACATTLGCDLGFWPSYGFVATGFVYRDFLKSHNPSKP